MKTKKEIVKYLESIDWYFTMNSWNGSIGYSFNVKIHSLPLTREQKDNLYQIISDDGLSAQFYDDCQILIDDFEEKMIDLGRAQTREIYHEGRGWINPGDTDYQERINRILSLNLTEESRKEFEEARNQKKAIYGAFRTLEKKSNYTAIFNGRSGGHLVLCRWNGHNYQGTSWYHNSEELKEMSKTEVQAVYEVVREFEKLYNNLIDLSKQYGNAKIEEESHEVTRTVINKVINL